MRVMIPKELMMIVRNVDDDLCKDKERERERERVGLWKKRMKAGRKEWHLMGYLLLMEIKL